MEPTLEESSEEKRNGSQEDEGAVLEDLYGNADFDFDLSGVHSDVGNIFQKFVKKELIRATLKKQYSKAVELKAKASEVKQTLISTKNEWKQKQDKLKQSLKQRKQKLEAKINTPPFLRTSDKVAFTLGIVGLCVTEYIILKKPDLMATWYTFLIFPLLISRYFMYHKVKHHYFMLDFCYYVQVLLMVRLFFYGKAEFFQILFSLSTGPLCVAIVMWRNSLVFHDLDKLTSVFIHIFPPLVTFCMRWYPPNGDFSEVCIDPSCQMSVYYAMGIPFVYYCIWQLLYLVQTEVIDGDKLRNDKEIMTSVRWLTQVKPHPIYKMMLRYGLKPNPVTALVMVQGVYTFMTLLPNLFIFQSFELHCVYLSFVFLVCVWNGANYYFEIFSDTYSDRLQRYLKEVKEEKASKKAHHEMNGVQHKMPSVENQLLMDQTTTS